MGKISNVTNSLDPVSVNSRLFVGNLNTFALNKDAVETVFQRYGRIIGISMHKGFAFVQFTNEHDARKAVAGEDQRIYAGQQIDVNLSAEPKPMRASRKRQLTTGPEWDCFYNVPVVSGRPPLAMSIKTQADLAALQAFTAGAPPFKKAALLPMATPQPNIFASAMTPISPSRLIRKPTRMLRVPKPFMAAVTATQKTGANIVTASSPEASASTEAAALPPPTTSISPPLSPISFTTPQTVFDILICGGCHQIFDEVDRLQLHKRNCTKTAQPRQPQLCHRCQCDAAAGDPIGPLKCASCDQQFGSCWQLCQHVQSEHDVHIFALPPLLLSDLNNRDTMSDTGSIVDPINIEDPDEIDHQNPLITMMEENKLVDTRVSDAESDSSLISPTMHNGDAISAAFSH